MKRLNECLAVSVLAELAIIAGCSGAPGPKGEGSLPAGAPGQQVAGANGNGGSVAESMGGARAQGGQTASQSGSGANTSSGGAGQGGSVMGGASGGGDPRGGGGVAESGAGGATPSSGAGGAPDPRGGAAGAASYMVPRGKSRGCGASAAEASGKYVSHDIEVTGVDEYWLTMRKPYAGQAPYTFTHRSYAVRLPTDYDPNKAYPLVFQGGGCGNTDGTSGKNGADKIVPDSAIGEAITIGLSYVYPDGAGACFADDGENTYELPYWDAVYEAATTNYCVDLERVFIGGFSSGAWMTNTVAFARAGRVRGTGTGAGGIREKRPLPSNVPFAAFMVTGSEDDTNPIHRTKDGTSCSGSEAEGCWKGEIICGFPGAESCFDTGSAHARDEILKRNGCVGGDTQQYGEWSDCKRYTGCPEAFPVVYCTPPVGHDSGGDRHSPGIWNFWKSLPAVP